MRSSIKLNQVAKILISFASFCFIFPNALSDTGRAAPAETVQEVERKKAPAV